MVDIKNILVAVDGSEGSMKALSTAETMAKQNDAELTVVYVDHRPGATKGSDISLVGGDPNMRHTDILYDPIKEEDDGQFRTAKQMLTKAKNTVKEDITVNYYILFGNPSEEIIFFSNKIETDMIIIGKFGYSGVKKLLMGSVSTKVANNAGCTVVVVR